jgi:uncharacterized Fe-S cluster-containing radical SAM superfamily protein
MGIVIKMSRGLDPFKFGEGVRNLVTRDGSSGRDRLYKRAPSTDPRNESREFRVSNYYLKTAVADALGCNLRCVFCWTIDCYRNNSNIKNVGVFHSPDEVADALVTTARSFECKYLRMTEGEPTLDMDHLTGILDNLKKMNIPYTFILETNGLLFGKYPNLAKELSLYGTNLVGEPFIHARVSIKGATAKKFRLLSGADASFYKLQFKALSNCLDAGLSVHPAVMLDFIESKEEMETLRGSLLDVDESMVKKLEFERLFLEDYVVARLKKYGIPFEKVLKEG